VKRQLKEAQASRSKLENVEVELEQLRAAEGALLEEKRRMASQLSNETNNRRAVEERLEALQSGAELPPAAKVAQAKAREVEAELEKVRGELAKLEQDLAKSGNAAKELGVLKRKFEGVESELETLRAAEGKWLEEKRRMAAQLSNETNLRRDLEEKLKGEVAEAKAETASVKKKSKK
jgi:chromosome segregation ATPase